MAGTGIGTFNDRLRDAVRGGGPFDDNPRRAGLRLRAVHRPERRPGQRHRRRAEGPAAALPGPDQGRADRQPAPATRSPTPPGAPVTGAQVDYNGSPAGYTAAPGEAVTYVDAHDNEILYDALAYKLPAGTSAADRARMQVLALATAVLGQGTGFVAGRHRPAALQVAGPQLVQLRRLVQPIHWDCARGQRLRPRPAAGGRQRGQVAVRPAAAGRPGAGAGLRGDRRWPTRGTPELLRDPRVVAGVRPADRRPRCSGGCRSRCPAPARRPGVITMTPGRPRPGPAVDVGAVVFNATPAAADPDRPGAAPARTCALHPVLRDSADPVLRTASFDRRPARSPCRPARVAVFVQR